MNSSIKMYLLHFSTETHKNTVTCTIIARYKKRLNGEDEGLEGSLSKMSGAGWHRERADCATMKIRKGKASTRRLACTYLQANPFTYLQCSGDDFYGKYTV
jgi:hypothetical protein